MKLLIAVIVAAGVLAGGIARAGDAEKELRLSQAIDEALKNNPEIHVLQNKLQSARARGNQATYLDDPERHARPCRRRSHHRGGGPAAAK